MFWTLTLPPKWHTRRPKPAFAGPCTDPRIPSVGEAAVPVESRLEANRVLGRQLRAFAQGLNKWLARRGAPALRYFWIREDHKSGVPHLHLLVVSQYLAADLEARDMVSASIPADDQHLAPEAWRDRAVKCGFGVRFDAQRAHDRAGLAGYVTKVMARLSGEVTKQGQVVERLPSSCRSYGYSRGFLPPPAKRAEWTGWIDDEHQRKLGHRQRMLRALRQSFKRDQLGPVWGKIFDASNPLSSWWKGEWKDAAAIACQGQGVALEGLPARVYKLAPVRGRSEEVAACARELFASNCKELRALPKLRALVDDESRAFVGMDDDYVRRIVLASR